MMLSLRLNGSSKSGKFTLNLISSYYVSAFLLQGSEIEGESCLSFPEF